MCPTEHDKLPAWLPTGQHARTLRLLGIWVKSAIVNGIAIVHECLETCVDRRGAPSSICVEMASGHITWYKAT